MYLHVLCFCYISQYSNLYNFVKLTGVKLPNHVRELWAWRNFVHTTPAAHLSTWPNTVLNEISHETRQEGRF